MDAFIGRHGQAGGVVSFLGQVRGDGGVEALELKHYPPMTLPGMADLAATIERRWALEGLLLLHRVGLMVPGDAIVLVAAAARPSARCLRRRRFRDGSPERRSWFWKREKTAAGWRWIEPRAQDHVDRALVIGA
jgi:molybdopterin synthase catalytic subunit